MKAVQTTRSDAADANRSERRQQSRAAIVSAASVVIALLLVVAGAYTAAQESRTIAVAATDVQRIDVVRLRVAELESARLLARSGNPAFAATASELKAQSIADLTAASASNELPDPLVSALDEYLAAAQDDTANPEATAQVVDAIDEARTSMAERLDDSSSLLDSLSIVLVVTITYIGPALAFIVFWLAVRQTRRLREAQAALRDEQQRGTLRNALVQTRLHAIEATASNTHASQTAAAVRSGVEATRAMIDSIDGRLVVATEDVSLPNLLSEVYAEHIVVSGDRIQPGPNLSPFESHTVHADLGLTSKALCLVAANARRRGCTHLQIDASATADTVSLSFGHDGNPLTEAEARLVIDQVPLASNGALERGSELLLLAYATRLLEHSGATLDVRRSGGLERVVVTLRTRGRIIHEPTLPHTSIQAA